MTKKDPSVEEPTTPPEQAIEAVPETHPEPVETAAQKPVEAGRKPNAPRLPQVTRGCDPYVALIDALRRAEFGTFLVTIHAGQVVKYARVEQPVRVAMGIEEDSTIPG